jgi:hypothetical protein
MSIEEKGNRLAEGFCEKHGRQYCEECDRADRVRRAAEYAKLPRYRYPGLPYVEPFTEHTAESRWQTCGCQSCQEKRWNLEQAPTVRTR